MRRSSTGLVVLALFAVHAALWILMMSDEAARRDSGVEDHARRNGEMARIAGRIDALKQEFDVLFAPSSVNAASTSPAQRSEVSVSPASPSTGERLLDALSRTTRLEERISAAAWDRWWTWARLNLLIKSLREPRPLDPLELSRLAYLDCLTGLAFHDPSSHRFPQALAVLQQEIREHEDRLPLRLRALDLLRQLRPRIKDARAVGFSTRERGNETYHGSVLVAEDAIPGLIDVSRKHPELRSTLHRSLAGIRYPAVRAELIDALTDPRRYVREGAIWNLSEYPKDAERDAAFRRARDIESDSELRRLIERFL